MTEDPKTLTKNLQYQTHPDMQESERIRKVSIVMSRDRAKGPVRKTTSIKVIMPPLQSSEHGLLQQNQKLKSGLHITTSRLTTLRMTPATMSTMK